MIDNQTAFNKAWEHFVVKKNPPSVSEDPKSVTCRYRGPNGERCSAGLFIPDAEYLPDMENTSADDLLEEFDFLAKYMPGVDFLMELQGAHDDSATYITRNRVAQNSPEDFLARFKSEMARVAFEWELVVPGE